MEIKGEGLELMGKIFSIIGKSSTGKDTIYKKILDKESNNLKRLILYTTRPIREGEINGVEYNFVDIDTLHQLENENKVIESRCYHTIHGDWYYFMVKDKQIDLDNNDYLIIGTIESYIKIRDYFGTNKVVPIYIDLDDGERLTRALNREKKQEKPKYEEMCRRFLADSQDFSLDKIKEAGISTFFENDNLEECIAKIEKYINDVR